MSSTLERTAHHLSNHTLASILRDHNLPAHVPYYADGTAQSLDHMHPGSERFVSFLMANLERVKRQGGLTKLWLEPGNVLEESTAQHTRSMLEHARSLYGRNPEFDISVSRSDLLPLIVIHDGGEQLDGDFPHSVEMATYSRIHEYLRQKPEVLGDIGVPPQEVESFIRELIAGTLPPEVCHAFHQHVVTRFKHEYFEQQLPFMEKLMNTLPVEYGQHWMQLLQYFKNRKETLYQYLGIEHSNSPVSLQDLRTTTMGRFLDIYTEMQKFRRHGSWDWRNYQDGGGNPSVTPEVLRMNSVELSFTRFMEPAVLMDYFLHREDGSHDEEFHRTNALLVREWTQHTIRDVGAIEISGEYPWQTAAEQANSYYLHQIRSITTQTFSPVQFYSELDLFNHRTGSPPIWAGDLIQSQVDTFSRNRVA